jgi:hypothetical protein
MLCETTRGPLDIDAQTAYPRFDNLIDLLNKEISTKQNGP